jgi:hypothetical protein
VSAIAQSNFGSIVGAITDQTGASVPGAQITLTNLSTNATQTVKAGAGGNYTFLNLSPGAYNVSVTNAGFKSTTRNGVDVTIGGTTRVDAALSVGDVTQTVSVDAAATAELQTDTVSLGGVVEGRQVVESPLNGRNVNNLLDFIPGVVPGGGTAGNTVANGGSGSFQVGTQTQAIAYGNYQIGGGFSGQSLFFIDGVESNIPENNVNSLVPTQDSVQEFRVSTNNVTAEFGGFSGGVVQISSKSGTNKFHGTAYDYFRNTVLDANDYFDNQHNLKRQPLHQNQYGFNIGGPIKKDKLFFFFSFEREPVTSGGLDTFTLPTAAQLNGDFSAFTAAAISPANPTGQILYNPATGAPYACNGIANTLCPNQIDPTALKLLQLEFPLPNTPGLNGQGLINNFVGSAPITGAQNEFNARVDYNVGKADQLFARYTFWNPHNGDSDPLGTKTGAGPTGNTTTEAVVGDNHVFNPSTIADLRLSWLENYNFQLPLSDGFDQSSINPNYGALQAMQVNNHQGLLPGLGFQNYSGGAELSQLYWLNTAYSINGSITKVKGRHTIKVGGNGRQIEWTSFGNNQGLGLSANNAFTACPTASCGAALNSSTGNAIASFLLGVPSSTGISEVGTARSVLHSYGFYGVDTWQVNGKLTLNLGLRWEQPGSYSEVNNNDTVLLTNLPTGLPAFTNPVTGTTQPTVGGLAFVASPQYGSRREENLHWKLFSPREGFDYRLDGKTVIRGGYGIAFLPAEFTADGPGGSPINSAGTGLSNTPGQTYAGAPTVANPLPNGINQPLGRNPLALTQLLGEGIGSRVPDQPYGYVQQLNFGVERELDSKSTLSVAYAESKGTHLVLSQGYTGTGLNLDQLPDQYDAIGGDPNAGTGLFAPVANPYAGQFTSGGQLNQPTVFEGFLLKPFPQYTGVSEATPRRGASTYNALQVAYKRAFPHSGQVQLAYTYAKLISNTDNTSSFEDGQGGQGVVQDNYNLQAEKSVSLQDLTHNLVVNYGIDLPFGHGQMYLANSNAVVNALVGGWRMNGITTLHSGLPVPFNNNSTNYLGTFGAGPIRPNVVAGCDKHVGGSAQQRAATGWFNVNCFTHPGVFSFGDERRVDSNIRAGGAANWDLSANKTFPLYEKFTGKFSVEAFNLFNRTQFGAPDSGLGDGGFGLVTSQRNLPRVLQFALRVSY